MMPFSGKSECVNHVTIIDVEEGRLLPDRTVLVEGERIEKIFNSEIGTPEGLLQIDGSGLYLMPGLVDAHVHFFDPPTFGPMMIAFGVTSIRDMGNPTAGALAIRDKLQEGKILGPEMFTTGSVLDGYPPFIPPISIACKTVEQGREAVRKQAAAGVNQIKVYSGLEREVFFAIADEAKRLGLKVVGHVPEAVYIEEAAVNGQQSCEHLFGFGNVIAKLLGERVMLRRGGIGEDVPYFLRLPEVNEGKLREALEKIRSHGMAVCPTLNVFKCQTRLKDILAGEYPTLEYASPLIRGIWNQVWGRSAQDGEMTKILPLMQRFVKILHDAHVTLLVGTDLLFPGVIPGYSIHEEMVLWQEAGVPSSDILRSATTVSTRFLGLDHRLGRITEGNTASMVLVRENPLEDIKNAGKIEGVFLRGRFFNRNELDRLMQETRNLCK
jgi:imidazolonepropionase-like amidohydrolase